MLRIVKQRDSASPADSQGRHPHPSYQNGAIPIDSHQPKPSQPFSKSNWSVGNDPHNHPSGDPTANPADIQLTRQLREAAAAVDIPLLDHVIIGRRGAYPLGRRYYSFREKGLL
jgi:hypothetical protein